MLFRILAALAMALTLNGCGSSEASTIAAPATPATDTRPALDANTAGLRITRPALADDGYDGGINVTRDTSAAAGGLRGNVSAGGVFRTVAGQNVTGFEWNLLAILDNHARGGENVAFYAQANKHGTGPTWAAVSEAADTTGSSTPLIAHEFDVWATGPDSGARLGLDVVVGDARAFRGLGRSDIAEASTGVRISASGGSPYARWTRAIELRDGMQVGIDTSPARIGTGTALRLADGQAISLDATDSTTLRLQNGRVSITSGGRAVFEVDVNDGGIYRFGQRIL